MNRLSLVPQAHAMEVLKLTEPNIHGRNAGRVWKVEMMRFIPHSGKAA